MGAGAIGCFVGGCIASRGTDVVFVGRERLKQEIDGAGLTLTDLDGATRRIAAGAVSFASDPSVLRGCTIVLCCVKSAQTAEAAMVIPRDALVISLQNGMRNGGVLREKLPNVLAGIVGFNVVSKGNGEFRRATTGPLVIEDRGLVSAELFGGLEVELAKDVRAKQWSKLVMNLNNAVSALTDRPTPELLFKPEFRRILRALIGEAVDVFRAAKVRTARLGPLPISLFPSILRLPTPLLRIVAAAQLKVDPEARSSMWEDLQRGRLTEVDELNGEIVRLAESRGIDAPLNRRIVEIVHEVEQKRAGSPQMTADDLWTRLTRAPQPRP